MAEKTEVPGKTHQVRRLKVHGSFTRPGQRQEATVTLRIALEPSGGPNAGRPDPTRPVVLEARVARERTVLRLDFDRVVEALFSRDAKDRARNS